MSDAIAEIPIRKKNDRLEVHEDTEHDGDVRLPIIEWRFKQGDESDAPVDRKHVKFRITGIHSPEGCTGEPPQVPFRLPGNPRTTEAAMEILEAKEYDFVDKPLRLRAKASAFTGIYCECAQHVYELDIAVDPKDENPAAGGSTGGSFDPHIIFGRGDDWDEEHDPSP